MDDGPMIMTLDLATRFGFCIGRPGTMPVFGSDLFAPEKSSSGAIFAGVQKWTAENVQAYNVNEIVYEAPLDPRHLKKTTRATILRLNGLPACVEGMAHLCKVFAVHEVPAATVRSYLHGKKVRKADAKKLVIDAVQKRGFDCDDPDAADAIAIWLYRCHILGHA